MKCQVLFSQKNNRYFKVPSAVVIRTLKFKGFTILQLVEHSTGITDEPIPDLTMMTIGSELSISEAFNKTDLSDTDSLKSFEKHEMSTVDSESLSNSRTDESWAGKQSGKLLEFVLLRYSDVP